MVTGTKSARMPIRRYQRAIVCRENRQPRDRRALCRTLTLRRNKSEVNFTRLNFFRLERNARGRIQTECRDVVHEGFPERGAMFELVLRAVDLEGHLTKQVDVCPGVMFCPKKGDSHSQRPARTGGHLSCTDRDVRLAPWWYCPLTARLGRLHCSACRRVQQEDTCRRKFSSCSRSDRYPPQHTNQRLSME